MRFRPLDDRLIIKPLEVKTQTDSGIYLPDEAQEPADEGDVVAVGPGARIDGTDQRTTMAVNVGDRVRYGRYSGHEVLLDGEKFYCIKEDQVLMIESKPLMDIGQIWTDGEKHYLITQYDLVIDAYQLTDNEGGGHSMRSGALQSRLKLVSAQDGAEWARFFERMLFVTQPKEPFASP